MQNIIMSLQKKIIRRLNKIKQTLFKIYIKDTDILHHVMFGHVIWLKFKNIQYIQRYKIEWRKLGLIKVTGIENEEIIMAMVMAKIIITVIMKTIIMMIMRIKIGNRIKM